MTHQTLRLGKCWKLFRATLIWRQKWTPSVRHGTSLIVRRVSSGRPIVVLFWTKYAFPRQFKPRILKLTTSKGHSNFFTVNCEEKEYYRVVSVGHLIFDCRSYCGRSCRMQGMHTPSHTNVCKFFSFQHTCSQLILHLKC